LRERCGIWPINPDAEAGKSGAVETNPDSLWVDYSEENNSLAGNQSTNFLSAGANTEARLDALPSLRQDEPLIVCMSGYTWLEIIGERPGQFGTDYKFKLESPLLSRWQRRKVYGL
jgi:hypothetical protein